MALQFTPNGHLRYAGGVSVGSNGLGTAGFSALVYVPVGITAGFHAVLSTETDLAPDVYGNWLALRYHTDGYFIATLPNGSAYTVGTQSPAQYPAGAWYNVRVASAFDQRYALGVNKNFDLMLAVNGQYQTTWAAGDGCYGNPFTGYITVGGLLENLSGGFDIPAATSQLRIANVSQWTYDTWRMESSWYYRYGDNVTRGAFPFHYPGPGLMTNFTHAYARYLHTAGVAATSATTAFTKYSTDEVWWWDWQVAGGGVAPLFVNDPFTETRPCAG